MALVKMDVVWVVVKRCRSRDVEVERGKEMDRIKVRMNDNPPKHFKYKVH